MNSTKPLPNPTQAVLSRRADITALLFLIALTAFRFYYAGTHDLVQDEAYYWQWSRHLAWGYYDNTPLLAPLIRFGTLLFGSTQIGVRSAAIICSLGAQIFLYLLAKRLRGVSVALWATVLAACIPLFSTGSILMTQDPVQIVFWLATAYVAHRALTDKPGWGWWVLTGCLAGLTIMAKLNGLLLLPSMLLYLLLSPTARQRWLRSPQPYIAGLISLAIFMPFVWWNHTHGDAFWLHIHAMANRTNSSAPPLSYFGNFLGAQVVLISPIIFLMFLWILWTGFRRGALREGDDSILYLWCFSFAAFAATMAVSLHAKTEGNWGVAAYLTGAILVADELQRLSRGKGAWLAGLAIGSAALVSAIVLYPQIAYHAGFQFANPTFDRTNETLGWKRMASVIAANEQAIGGNPFVFGVNYRMPSEAAFYLPGQPQTYSLFLHERANEYMFWENPAQLIGRNAVFVNDTDGPDHFHALSEVFTKIAPQPPLLIYRNPPYKTPIRTLQIVRCYGFKGYDPSQWQQGW